MQHGSQGDWLSWPAPDDLVLIAIMPEPRDMEIARMLGWYRIPLSRAPKVISVDYVGFYQPSGFRSRKWRVEVIAAVHGHELLTRGELLRSEADHPRAHQEYYKLQLGPLISLPAPILAEDWKRITFLYTTGERLLAARTIKDLVVRSEGRRLLWRNLRERALAAGEYRAEGLPTEASGPRILSELLGLTGLLGDQLP